MIAIHSKSGPFASEWLVYCQVNNIPFKEVDCFAPDIIQQLVGCDVLLWHWLHNDFRAQLFARQLTLAVEETGVTVFPGTPTAWHYDDKVGQKYLLEAVGAPFIPTHIFYDQKSALSWVDTTSFPKVWKLRGGAGSQNVQLVTSRGKAKEIVKKSFSIGWKNSRFHQLKERLWHLRRDKTFGTFFNLLRGVARAIRPHQSNAQAPLQKSYVYFQDFVPDNDCDIRVVVIGERAFAVKRMVRDGDFRASGSGFILYDREEFPEECIRIAFDVTDRLKSQCCAFDFVNLSGQWLIVEISYSFSSKAYKPCPGYWDRSLAWHAEPVTPERFILEDLLTTSKTSATK